MVDMVFQECLVGGESLVPPGNRDPPDQEEYLVTLDYQGTME